MFQYILCCCLTQFPRCPPKSQVVSIHLMLLFNHMDLVEKKSKIIVSIHLMLLFNGCRGSRWLRAGLVSIHLMLLFNWITEKQKEQIIKFQYILCCCLTNVFKPFYKIGFLSMPLFYTIPWKITSVFCESFFVIKNYCNVAYLQPLYSFIVAF